MLLYAVTVQEMTRDQVCYTKQKERIGGKQVVTEEVQEERKKGERCEPTGEQVVTYE